MLYILSERLNNNYFEAQCPVITFMSRDNVQIFQNEINLIKTTINEKMNLCLLQNKINFFTFKDNIVSSWQISCIQSIVSNEVPPSKADCMISPLKLNKRNPELKIKEILCEGLRFHEIAWKYVINSYQACKTNDLILFDLLQAIPGFETCFQRNLTHTTYLL